MPLKDSKQTFVALGNWLQSRHQAWQRLEKLVDDQKGHKLPEADDVLELVRSYRAVARDLTLVRQAMMSPAGGTQQGCVPPVLACIAQDRCGQA